MVAPLVLSFDLDDTLWPVGPVMIAAEKEMWGWLRAHHPEAMREHSLETMRELRAKVAAAYPERDHDMTFMRRRTLFEMFGSTDDSQLHAERAFEVFYTARNRVTLYEDVEAQLKRLRRQYRLFAVSNGNADLHLCGVAHLFEGHVTAISAGAAKPDPRIFAQLAKEAGVEPQQILHIGDDPLADVVGAMQAGMQAAWLNRDAKPWPTNLASPERTIATLAEII